MRRYPICLLSNPTEKGYMLTENLSRSSAQKQPQQQMQRGRGRGNNNQRGGRVVSRGRGRGSQQKQQKKQVLPNNYNFGYGQQQQQPQEQKQDEFYKVIKGDLFSSPESSSLCHCVSRDIGMGKGIAVHFKRMFGGVMALKNQRAKIGECAILMRQNRFVYYLITKERGYMKPTYDAVTDSIEYMKNHAVINQVSHISMPKIGCGLDRLAWNRVEEIIRSAFENTNIRISVYEL